MSARTVTHVAALVGLDDNRRRVRTANGAPARLNNKEVTKIRLCWRVAGEANQRTRVYPKDESALARRHHDELVAAKVSGTPLGADGFPLTTEELARPSGKRYTFRSYLNEVYIPAHPEWTPKHRGNTKSIGNIIAGMFVYPAQDLRGRKGDEIWLDEITSDDCDRMIQARKELRLRGTATGSKKVSTRTEEAARKLASAVFGHALDRTPPAINRNPIRRRKQPKSVSEIRSRAEEADTAWTSADVDLVATCITPHYAPLIQCRGRTALRPSEAALVEPGDVDIARLTLEARGGFHIETRKHNDGRRYRTGPLKHRDEDDVRIVPIADHPPLITALTEAIAAAPGLNDRRRREITERRSAAAERGDTAEVKRLDEELDELSVVRVFRNPDGSPIDWGDFVTDHWKPALELAFADLPDDDDATLARKARRRATKFYDLRHMAEAIWLYEFGIPVKVISKWVGTGEPTLMKHYSRRSAHYDQQAWDQATSKTDDTGSGHQSAATQDAGEVIDLATRRNRKQREDPAS